MNNAENSSKPPQGMHPLDAMLAAPNHHSVLLENEKIRVLDTRLGPGERTPVHTHQWPGALYVLSWSDFVRYDPAGNVLVDSRTMLAKPEIGSAIWSAPLAPHYVQNVGQTDLHIIAIEVKSSQAPAVVKQTLRPEHPASDFPATPHA